MDAVKAWLKSERIAWDCDFIGIAVNTAPPQEAKEIRWLYTEGPKNNAHQKIRLRIGRGIAGIVWKTARPQSEDHLQSQPEKLMEYPISRTEKLESALAVPVFAPVVETPLLRQNQTFIGTQTEVIGVLMVGFRRSRKFNQEEITKLTACGADVAYLLQKEAEKDDRF